MENKGTYCSKMGNDSLAENTPNAREIIYPIYPPNLSAQAQKFWISMKKGFIVVRDIDE